MRPAWHDGALDALVPGDAPVAWSVNGDGAIAAAVLAGVAATAEDLADAARSAGDGGWPVVRRRLARALVGRVSGVPAEAVRLGRSAAGAPLVLAPDGWHLGLSGRDGDMLIAVARVPVAVDREPLDDAPPLRDMLTSGERDALDRLPAADRPVAWLRRWTIKEAHAKLIGEPLRIGPEAIETRILSDDEATATFEGLSRCWTRRTATALETVATWA